MKTWARCRWSASWPSSSPRSQVVPPPSPWVTPAEPAPHPKERAIQSKDIRINEGIRVREVRVVSAEGEQLGILPIAQALELARQREMDLVEVAAEAQPPVCRIMDFGKYKYMQARRQKDARKKQTIIQVKEVKLGPKTDTHDFDFKAKHVRRFLEEGNKAKVTVRFKGREMAHTELGWKMLNKMVEGMQDIAVIENHPRMEGRMLSMILSPKPH
ncbi:MAG TPA: translation initiation factor IF-3 [Myxococcales bacterium]|nr:translation initiation factor IF-3 [Myxococcales bacterium]